MAYVCWVIKWDAHLLHIVLLYTCNIAYKLIHCLYIRTLEEYRNTILLVALAGMFHIASNNIYIRIEPAANNASIQ